MILCLSKILSLHFVLLHVRWHSGLYLFVDIIEVGRPTTLQAKFIYYIKFYYLSFLGGTLIIQICSITDKIRCADRLLNKYYSWKCSLLELKDFILQFWYYNSIKILFSSYYLVGNLWGAAKASLGVRKGIRAGIIPPIE